MKPRTELMGYGAILFWMLGPLISTCIASLIAVCCGCELNESTAHPCFVFGIDIGGILYGMLLIVFVTGVTFQTGVLALIVFTAIVFWERW